MREVNSKVTKMNITMTNTMIKVLPLLVSKEITGMKTAKLENKDMLIFPGRDLDDGVMIPKRIPKPSVTLP